MTTPYTIVVLVTENNVQATSFQSYLAEQLALPILLVSTLEALPEQDGRESHPLFLVDLDYLKSSQQGGWPREISSRFGEANTILLNAPTSTDRELLLMWPHTSGLFFRQDPLDRLVLGIRKVLQGEYWIPRHLLCDLVNYYRKGGGTSPAQPDAADCARAGDHSLPDDGCLQYRDCRQSVCERAHHQVPPL